MGKRARRIAELSSDLVENVELLNSRRVHETKVDSALFFVDTRGS